MNDKQANQNFFKTVDLSQFWDDSGYPLKTYVEPLPDSRLVESVENELGYKLPASYIWLMQKHNGGSPVNTCFPTNTPTSWASDHVAIKNIKAIGRDKIWDLCGSLGSKHLIEEWEYPAIGVCIADCPSAGHDAVFLDYRKCGPNGEPSVVHIDQDNDYEITFLAKDFETFIQGLVNEDIYNNDDPQADSLLSDIATKSFSTPLQHLLAIELQKSNIDFDLVLRKLCSEIIKSKNCFELHNDETSNQIYDYLFYLYSRKNNGVSIKDFLSDFPQLLVLAKGDVITTHGYAPNFIEEWLYNKISEGNIILQAVNNRFVLTAEYVKKLLKIALY